MKQGLIVPQLLGILNYIAPIGTGKHWAILGAALAESSSSVQAHAVLAQSLDRAGWLVL